MQFCKQHIFLKGTVSYMFHLIIHHWGVHIRRYESCYLLMRTAQWWLISWNMYMFVPLKNIFFIWWIVSWFYFSNIQSSSEYACVESLSSKTFSTNTGFSWIKFSHNQRIISVTNQCFGYISYNYINYIEQRNGFFILRSGGTSYA